MWTQYPTRSSPVPKSWGPKEQTPRSPGLEDGVLTSQGRTASDTFQQFLAGSNQVRASAINPTPKSASAAALGIPEVLAEPREGGATSGPAPIQGLTNQQASSKRLLEPKENSTNLFSILKTSLRSAPPLPLRLEGGFQGRAPTLSRLIGREQLPSPYTLRN